MKKSIFVLIILVSFLLVYSLLSTSSFKDIVPLNIFSDFFNNILRSFGITSEKTIPSHGLIEYPTDCNSQCKAQGFTSGVCRTSTTSQRDPCYDQTPDYIVTTLNELLDVTNKVVPGDLVCIRSGTYQPTSVIKFTKSGTSDNPIIWGAYRSEKVIFDGSLATEASLGGGFEPPLVRVDGNWNILRNIEVRYSPGSGIWVFGDDNVLDHVEIHHNKGIGAGTYGDRCQFLYCVAHDNIDPQATIPGGDADGLGASVPSSGSYFLGCLNYGNSDDGFDLYGSTGNTIEKCVAHSNGLLQGDGQGFKLGIGGKNRVSKSIAYNNRDAGFGSEEDAPNNIIDHCTAYNNEKVGFMSAYISSSTFTNNIGSFSQYQAEPTQYSNTWNLGITDPGFISTNPSSDDFLSLSSNSPCRGKASDGSDLGALQYGESISDLMDGNGGCQPGETPIEEGCDTGYICCCKPTCSPLNYPSDKWQRVWYVHSTGDCLGDGPDESSRTFDNDWGSETIAYERADDIEFRSSRTINFPTEGTYTFTVGSDDGIRLWIDDEVKIDKWIDRSYDTDSIDVDLTAGDHKFRIDWYENEVKARVSFDYKPTGSTQFSINKQVLPWGTWKPDADTRKWVAEHFDVVNDGRPGTTVIQDLKNYNSDIIFLSYIDVLAAGSTLFGDYTFYEDDYVHADDGTWPVYQKTYGFKIMNPASSHWRQVWAEVALKVCQNQGLSGGGIFADDVWSHIDEYRVKGGLSMDEADATWYNNMKGFLSYVKGKLGNYLLIGNTPDNGALVDAMDGKWEEGFVHARWQDYGNFPSVDNWKKKIDGVKTVSQKGKIELVSGGCDELEGTGSWGKDNPNLVKQLLGFCFGSYLLGASGENSGFNFGTYWNTDGSHGYYPIFDDAKQLGNPVNDYYQFGSVYARDFDNGKVLVNPSSSTYTVSLGGSYKTLDGKTVSSITMSGHTGEILLKT